MYSKQDSILPFQVYHNLCSLHLAVTVQEYLHDLRLNRIR